MRLPLRHAAPAKSCNFLMVSAERTSRSAVGISIQLRPASPPSVDIGCGTARPSVSRNGCCVRRLPCHQGMRRVGGHQRGRRRVLRRVLDSVVVAGRITRRQTHSGVGPPPPEGRRWHQTGWPADRPAAAVSELDVIVLCRGSEDPPLRYYRGRGVCRCCGQHWAARLDGKIRRHGVKT